MLLLNRRQCFFLSISKFAPVLQYKSFLATYDNITALPAPAVTTITNYYGLFYTSFQLITDVENTTATISPTSEPNSITARILVDELLGNYPAAIAIGSYNDIPVNSFNLEYAYIACSTVTVSAPPVPINCTMRFEGYKGDEIVVDTTGMFEPDLLTILLSRPKYAKVEFGKGFVGLTKLKVSFVSGNLLDGMAFLPTDLVSFALDNLEYGICY